MGRSIITLDDLTVNNLGTFKKINESSLPTTYPETWYKDSLNSDQVVKLAYYSELPVGAVKGKLINSTHSTPSFESSSSAGSPSKLIPDALYIESLAVLKAYRRQGIASALLDWIISEAKQRFVHQIVLHVHINNTDAIDWYKKKSFVQSDKIINDYYKQQGLDEPDAVVLTLHI